MPTLASASAARAPGGFAPIRCSERRVAVASRHARLRMQNQWRSEAPIQLSIAAERRRRRSSSSSSAVSASSSASTSSAASTGNAGADYLALKGIRVYPAAPKGGKTSSSPVDLLSLFRASPEDRTALVFLTHAGDLAPQELVPRLAKKLPALRAQGVNVLVFLMGTPENAAAFAETVGLGDEVEGGRAVEAGAGAGGPLFFADLTASAYDALGFSKGFDPELPIVGKGVLSGWVR